MKGKWTFMKLSVEVVYFSEINKKRENKDDLYSCSGQYQLSKLPL